MLYWQYSSRYDSTQDEREGEWLAAKGAQAGTQTKGCHREDTASVHGTPALPTELNGGPRGDILLSVEHWNHWNWLTWTLTRWTLTHLNTDSLNTDSHEHWLTVTPVYLSEVRWNESLKDLFSHLPITELWARSSPECIQTGERVK